MFLDLLFVICMLMLLSSIFFLIKNENAFKNRSIILNAIHDYNSKCLDDSRYDDMVDYNMESYDSTVYRIFDWGYENIVSKEVMKKIRPFVKETK